MSVISVKGKPSNLPCFHGGDIQGAALAFGVPEDQWIDLSTGINPNAFSVDTIPQVIFNRLPYLDSAFLQAAKSYYRAEGVPVAGSQEAIEYLPTYLSKLPVMVPEVGYQEYANQFNRSGFQLNPYPSLGVDEMWGYITSQLSINPDQHVVIINPNNPTGVCLSKERLRQLALFLGPKGLLIVDEAFIDLTPDNSLLNGSLPTNCIVLRSFGKFFGLAGLRLGFVFANEGVMRDLSQALSPWRINGCAQYIATRCYQSTEWQCQTRRWIHQTSEYQSQQLLNILHPIGAVPMIQQGLFSSYLIDTNKAERVFQRLAQQGVLVRLIPVNQQVSILRFGLLSTQWKALKQRLSVIK